MDKQEIFQKIYQVSEETSTDVYVVGGYVRDELLGIEKKKDIDFVVGDNGLEFARHFSTHFSEEDGRLVEFLDFDTARFIFFAPEEDVVKTKIVIGGQGLEEVIVEGLEKIKKRVLFEIEFAGARSEIYDKESRKPLVTATSIENDLLRRDFTVNAMARKVSKDGKLEKIIDPFGGQKDLVDKVLRTPLNPNETFSDDPLRMLRAVRFASQLDFAIEENTLRAIHTNRKRLGIVSKERIQEELMKLFATVKPSVGLVILYQTKLIDEFIPEMTALAGVEEVKGYSHKDNLSHTFAVVDNIAENSNKPLLRFSGLLHDIAKPDTKKFTADRGWTFDMHEHLGKKMTREICHRLKFSKKDTDYLTKLVRYHLQPIALMDKGVTDSPVRRMVIDVGEDLDDLLVLCRADITTGNQNKKARRLKNYDVLEKRIAEVIERDKLKSFQSPIRGEEIMEITGLKAGPTVGKIKKRIEDAILDGAIANDRDEARVFFESIKDEYISKAGEWEKN
ncbi:MAG: tRNA nucleotidyltransferase [Candidatus Magasanikbacteria bacterium CG_4_10_14_0_2_um_filter_37_12]|uniref:tRNA nucleotidyltransferase n=1 Tax=Candidatus Magasanikbacteria bacterium CG_4_10_14_0_2_um_filter_37_12 TaxID=1974637 RepID=A0A2M7V7W3_9BACT|nr:MAG: tRNA nucleotidyltransferase [Candidatus Magasanikbacteria bacterium CG_4_10_14_0_2_um_filter_37_12]